MTFNSKTGSLIISNVRSETHPSSFDKLRSFQIEVLRYRSLVLEFKVFTILIKRMNATEISFKFNKIASRHEER